MNSNLFYHLFICLSFRWRWWVGPFERMLCLPKEIERTSNGERARFFYVFFFFALNDDVLWLLCASVGHTPYTYMSGVPLQLIMVLSHLCGGPESEVLSMLTFRFA